YLRDRLELRQSARRLASELDPLGALARGIRRALVPQPDIPVLDAYLVDRGRVGEFVAMVEQLHERLEDVELVCTGPWPAYSRASVAAIPTSASSSGIGGVSASTILLAETITMKRSLAAATAFSRVCAPPPPLTSQPAGSTSSAPSIVTSRRAGASRPANETT